MKPRYLILISCLMLAGCPAPPAGNPEAAAPDARPALKSLAGFPFGVAVPAGPAGNSLLDSPERQSLVNRHFDSLTAENIMKMRYLQPEPGNFVFEHADALVDYAQQQGMLIHGHVLVWHTQAPEWMNDFTGSREQFVRMLETHVRTVAGHFAGRLTSWDVVNEAFDDADPAAYRNTIWYENIGPDYIEHAFRLAREQDRDADLYYIDYDLSDNGAKLDRVLEMVDDFQARGVPIDGIGFQMHIDTRSPAVEAMREAFARAVERGVKVRISELDVAVNIDSAWSEFTPELAEAQRQRYSDVARVYRETVPPALRGGITVWGITDGDSWIPGFRERPDWPLLWDADFEPKPALDGLVEGLTGP